MKLLDNLRRPTPQAPQNLVTPASFGFNGNTYWLPNWSGSRPDIPDQTFLGYIGGIHNRNGVVAAAVEARALLMSQLWFEWSRDGERFSNLWTRRLNDPTAGAGVPRPQFWKQVEYDVSYHGAAYIVADGAKLRRLRPDHCSVVLGSNVDPDWDGTNSTYVLPHDAEVAALLYHPAQGGFGGGTAGVQMFMPGQFTIHAPEPDPVSFWRGTSWVTAVMREITADGQASDHQQKFFSNAATPNLVFMMDPQVDVDKVRAFKEIVDAEHAGSANAYRNLFLGGGTDVKVVGSSLESLNLKDLTGGFENRIAIRSRIPAVVLGAREGLSGSSLNAGNYASARRLLADGWFAPSADALCASLERLVVKPAPNAELCYDRDRVLFLQEDQKDAADILATKAAAARQLTDGGFDPQSVIDLLGLGKLEHTGQLSVQLQEPGAELDASLTQRPKAELAPEPKMPEIHNHINVTRSDVTVEPAQVTVEPASVHVDAPQIDVHVPEVRAEAPVVQVNVDPTPVTVDNTVNVEPTPVTVRNEVDVETPPAQVTVVGDDRRSKFKVRRDSKGQITEVAED